MTLKDIKVPSSVIDFNPFQANPCFFSKDTSNSKPMSKAAILSPSSVSNILSSPSFPEKTSKLLFENTSLQGIKDQESDSESDFDLKLPTLKKRHHFVHKGESDIRQLEQDKDSVASNSQECISENFKNGMVEPAQESETTTSDSAPTITTSSLDKMKCNAVDWMNQLVTFECESDDPSEVSGLDLNSAIEEKENIMAPFSCSDAAPILKKPLQNETSFHLLQDQIPISHPTNPFQSPSLQPSDLSMVDLLNLDTVKGNASTAIPPLDLAVEEFLNTEHTEEALLPTPTTEKLPFCWENENPVSSVTATSMEETLPLKDDRMALTDPVEFKDVKKANEDTCPSSISSSLQPHADIGIHGNVFIPWKNANEREWLPTPTVTALPLPQNNGQEKPNYLTQNVQHNDFTGLPTSQSGMPNTNPIFNYSMHGDHGSPFYNSLDWVQGDAIHPQEQWDWMLSLVNKRDNEASNGIASGIPSSTICPKVIHLPGSATLDGEKSKGDTGKRRKTVRSKDSIEPLRTLPKRKCRDTAAAKILQGEETLKQLDSELDFNDGEETTDVDASMVGCPSSPPWTQDSMRKVKSSRISPVQHPSPTSTSAFFLPHSLDAYPDAVSAKSKETSLASQPKGMLKQHSSPLPPSSFLSLNESCGFEEFSENKLLYPVEAYLPGMNTTTSDPSVPFPQHFQYSSDPLDPNLILSQYPAYPLSPPTSGQDLPMMSSNSNVSSSSTLSSSNSTLSPLQSTTVDLASHVLNQQYPPSPSLPMMGLLSQVYQPTDGTLGYMPSNMMEQCVHPRYGERKIIDMHSKFLTAGNAIENPMKMQCDIADMMSPLETDTDYHEPKGGGTLLSNTGPKKSKSQIPPLGYKSTNATTKRIKKPKNEQEKQQILNKRIHRRRERNRLAARRSRERKTQYMSELEEQLNEMKDENDRMRRKLEDLGVDPEMV